jgi:energy-coupling factor transport system substrate-specific component
LTNPLVLWSKKHFPPSVLTLIPVGVALNLGLGTLVQIIKLPVFLDSIGTVLVAVLAGPWPAIMTGVVTVFVAGFLTNPFLPWFVATAVAIGSFTGICANRGAFKRLWVWAICGLLMGVISGIVSAPVIAYLFGGVTQSGSSLLVAYLMATGKTVLRSVILAGIACDPVDKLLTFVIVWFLIRGIPKGLLAHFPKGLENTQSSVLAVGKTSEC